MHADEDLSAISERMVVVRQFRSIEKLLSETFGEAHTRRTLRRIACMALKRTKRLKLKLLTTPE